eukprot:TRINITY_DN104549_c0_g1_i1.p1 TRINITY_DN104549_c0_g1~~TRINITY_DN104549_c0_g1_i1.p1  ORF type:complete len:261 (+),score=26.52 TRINITY_DN104549_c0_g1_i1:97-783(+)
MATRVRAKFMILPGNGCDDIEDANWYHWLHEQLQQEYASKGLECILETMPDPYEAKEKYWIPFVKEKVNEPSREVERGEAPVSETLVFLLGHSSGAVCLMRMLETYKIDGTFLVSGAINDLDEPGETISGYYPQQPDSDDPNARPWRWDLMVKHTGKFIMHIGSPKDEFIPVDHFRQIKARLEEQNAMLPEEDQVIVDYVEMSGGHFMTDEDERILKIVKEKLDKYLS